MHILSDIEVRGEVQYAKSAAFHEVICFFPTGIHEKF